MSIAPPLPISVAGVQAFEDAIHYWQSLRNGNQLPTRSDFRLTAKGVDSSISQIIEVISERDWRIRFQGAELMERAGIDSVGYPVFEAVPRQWSREFESCASRLREQPSAMVTEYLKFREGAIARRITLSLPMTDGAGIVRYFYAISDFEGIDGHGITSIETAATADEISVTAVDIGFGVPFDRAIMGAGKLVPADQLPAPMRDNVRLLTAFNYLERLRPQGHVLSTSQVNLARLNELEFDYAIFRFNPDGTSNFVAASLSVRERNQEDLGAFDVFQMINPALRQGFVEAGMAIRACTAAALVRYVAKTTAGEAAHVALMYPLVDEGGVRNSTLAITWLEKVLPGLERPDTILTASTEITLYAIDLGGGVPFHSKIVSV